MEDIREIARAFDRRAPTYAQNPWHRLCAERLVALCDLRSGDHVLDAATGTGFAALAAARVVGDRGRVVGVDVSPRMLEEAEAAVRAANLATTVELIAADATRPRSYAAAPFDAVTCAAGLLYMPVVAALETWRCLLRPGGVLAFTTLQVGSPPGGRLFRECAEAWGLSLPDPSEPLGTEARCRDALQRSGLTVTGVIDEVVEFSQVDLSSAWASNVNSPAHGAVWSLSADDRTALKDSYEQTLARRLRDDPDSVTRAGVLYALGRR